MGVLLMYCADNFMKTDFIVVNLYCWKSFVSISAVQRETKRCFCFIFTLSVPTLQLWNAVMTKYINAQVLYK
jgi:hypothetical protein